MLLRMWGNILKQSRICEHFYQRQNFPLPSKNLIASKAELLNFLKISRTFAKTSCLLEEASGSQSSFDRSKNTTVPKVDAVSYEKFEHLAPTKDTKARLQRIVREYEQLKYTGERVPSEMTEEEMKKLIQKPSFHQRIKYMAYLRKIELANLSEMKRKEERKALREQWKEKEATVDEYTYGLWHNSLFIRYSDAYMNKFYNCRLANAVMFGQKIIFDLGYDDVMQEREWINTAEQILMAYGANKRNCDPYYIHFCNAMESNSVLKQILKSFPNQLGLIHTTEKSYLDIFPKDQLVYLTPHARQMLDRYNPNDIYIIGAFVDKSIQKPLSLVKAKKEGLRMAKLPIDKYVVWKQGQKSLTIDQVFQILLEFKNTKDWRKAFKHLPKRKILTEDKMGLQEQLKDLAKRRQRTNQKPGLLVDLDEEKP